MLPVAPDLTDSVAYESRCVSARGRLLVPVSINGAAPYYFLLDTAIQSPVLDRDVASYLQLPQAGEPVAAQDASGKRVQAVAVEVGAFQFAGMPAHEVTMGVLDLSPLSERLGRRVAGLLPAYQAGLEATIDLAAASVTWRPLGAAGLEAEDSTALPITLDDRGAPTALFTVNGKHALSLEIDTVHSEVVALPRDFLSRNGLLEERTQRLVTPLGGGRSQTQIRLAELELSGAVVSRPVCTVLPDGEPGRVGLGFLKHFRITLGFEFGLMRLEWDGAKAVTDPPIVGYGVAPRRLSKGSWEVCVAEGSPAHRAGLRIGDYLGAVNGEALGDIGFEAVVNRLSAEAGATVTLSVARASSEAPSGYDYREVTLTAEPLL